MADEGRTPPAPPRTQGRAAIRLWESAPPRGIDGMPPEQTFSLPASAAGGGTTMLRNVSDPTLTVFTPAKANGSAVIICPGGGWSILAWEHEGVDVAEWFAARGYTALLLKYRLSATPPDADAFAARMAAMSTALAAPIAAAAAPRTAAQLIRDERLIYAREIAADDGRRALAIARERAAQWSVQPERIGMIGFSAGAFLVADVALDPQGPPPAFVAPIYGGETRGRPIPKDAPPLFTVVAHDDRSLFHMVEGLYTDWSEADRSAELHVFARGGHGFGMTRQGAPSDVWIDLLAAWLADKGFG